MKNGFVYRVGEPDPKYPNRVPVRFELRVTTDSTIDEIAAEIEKSLPWGTVGAFVALDIPDEGIERKPNGKPGPGPEFAELKRLLDRAWALKGWP